MNTRSMTRGVRRLAFLVLCIAYVSAHADRPRVGLVLGGGGARGAAHIGVLKELERRHIPIDAIAGTSMGAIVGGLYAAGKTPEELERIVTTLDWAAAMQDAPSREHLSFRRKLDEERYPIAFEIGINDGQVSLPMGLIQGQHLALMLRDLTIDVSHIRNFDELPIPFRAVATDVESGDARVLAGGDLAQAIRASMSVPAVFAPAEVDGRLLVDGGITANLPVDVMRAMDVDVIIAVDVEFPLYRGDELGSAVRISEQILTILMRRETLRQIELLGDDDILIRPELGTFASTDFGNTIETIAPGEAAVVAVSDQLARLSLDDKSFARHVEQRAVPEPIEAELAFVRVRNDAPVSSQVLESYIEVSPGDPVDAQRLAGAANDLYGLKYHEQVSYRLVEEGGATGVEFDARSRSYGPNVMKFAVLLENDFEGSTSFNVGAQLTKFGINSLGAEWQTDLQLGTDPQLVSEFYQPVSADSRFFVAPRIDLGQTNYNVFTDNHAIARYRVSESEFGFDAGTVFGSIGEFRLGTYAGTGNARRRVGDPSSPSFDFDTGGLRGRLRFDSRDDAQFPRRGVRTEVVWNSSLPDLGADERFETVEADIDGTWSHGKNTWNAGVAYATTMGSEGSLQDYFRLGGFLRLSGLERGEVSGPHAAMARLVYYRRVSESTGGVLDVPIYLGASLEAGNTWQDRSDIDFESMIVNGALFAGFDTVIGPVYLGAGFAEGGRRNYYLFFGAPPRW